MTSEPRTVESVHDPDTVRKRVADWVLIRGDRRVLAGCLVGIVTGVVWSLVAVDVLAVGPDSSVARVFGSGLISGVVTLLTIALSINQLVLSRVFGSVNVLMDRLDASRDLRSNVESIAGVPSSPTDPAEFLSLVARTLTDRANGMVAASERSDWDPPPELTSAMQDIAAYGENLDESLEANDRMSGILSALVGTEYALNITAVSHLRNEYAASIPEEVQSEFQAIEELLESVAVVRQFYKTITSQQDLATLSGMLVYSGIAALVATILVSLVYRASTVTVPVELLPLVVSVGIGVIFTPLTLFVAYILRAATVARQTVSVGPFVPPNRRE